MRANVILGAANVLHLKSKCFVAPMNGIGTPQNDNLGKGEKIR